MVKKLFIAMNNQLVGIWSQNINNSESFQYMDSWIESKYSRPISLSMPVIREPYKGEVVKHFFSNLIPERADVIEFIQRKYSIKKKDTFSILSKIGKDCIGAIQISDNKNQLIEKPYIKANSLTIHQVSQLIKSTRTSTFNITETYEPYKISLTGVQNKLALLFDKGSWKDPIGTTPSTHILKLPIEITENFNIFNSVENEWYCNLLYNAMDLPTPNCEILTFEDEKVLSVERFDRKRDKKNNIIFRLPQEDFCQVLNVPYFSKYQSDGGPSIFDIIKILNDSSNNNDSLLFYKSQVLNWLISATDGHAKNYSISIERNNSFKLTPFYDVMSFAPYIGNTKGQVHNSKVKLAMAIKNSSNKNKYKIESIRREHWNITAKKLNLSMGKYNSMMEEIIDTSISNIEKVNNSLPPTFPSIIAEKITNEVIKHVDILKSNY